MPAPEVPERPARTRPPCRGDRAAGAALGDRVAMAVRVASALDAVVVAKGAPTHVVAPGGATTTIEAATHRLATAGTGDVLAGVLAAIVAGSAAFAGAGASLASMAAEAVELHGHAAALAAADDRPITALDVAERLPAAVAARLSG